MTEQPHHCCVVEPRCRLCQFQLEDGDAVLVVRGGVLSPSFPFHVRHSYTFPHDTGSSSSSSTTITYHLCCRKSCMKRSSVAACFHEDCFAFKSFSLSPNFKHATHYDFTPSASDEVLRSRRIQRTLARKLALGVMGGMPEELGYMVAEHLVRECSIVTCQELTLQSHGSDSEVDLSRDVYATYVSFEGIQYVQSLSNDSPASRHGAKTELLLDAKHGDSLRNVYVAYDHLGIRRVYMETSKSPSPPAVPPTRGVWWSGLYKGQRLYSLTAKGDGLKLRQVRDSAYTGRDDVSPVHSWATPGPDRTLISLERGRVVQHATVPLRMSFLDCNQPGTDGYAAAIEGFHLMKLVAHPSGGDISFYKTLDNTAMPVTWMYLPLNPGETVREISAIRLFAHFVALLLRTNQERAVLFGSYYLDYGPGLKLNQLCTMTDAPSRLYFNEWDPVHGDNPWISYLGIDEQTAKLGDSVAGPVRDRPFRYPPSLDPEFPPPYSQSQDHWQYTNCLMDDVQQITPCMDRSLTYRSVIGMLLRYGDGRRACLGQFRLDWAATPLVVDPTRPLRVGFARSPVLLPYVAVIGQDETDEEPEDMRWLEIPWQGKLEWWSANGHCRLDSSSEGASRRSKKLTPWV